VERAILSCREAGITEFLVVVGYHKEVLIPYLKQLERRHGVSIQTVENLRVFHADMQVVDIEH